MFVMFTVIITGSVTLRVLNVSCNDIGDNGMAVISEALQHNKSLTTLGVGKCGLSAKGIIVCVLVIEILKTLYQLIYAMKFNL